VSILPLAVVWLSLSIPNGAWSYEPSWRSGDDSVVDTLPADQATDNDENKSDAVNDDTPDNDGRELAAGAPAPGGSGAGSKSLPDYTDKLRLKPGLRVTYRVHDGLDTRWKKIGDYEFTAEVEPRSQDYAYSYRWSMTDPVETSGIRAVGRDDLQSAHRVSLFYVDSKTVA